MKPSLWNAALLGALCSLGALGAKEKKLKPNFKCTDGSGNQIEIFLTKKANGLVLIDKKSKKKTMMVLSPPNYGSTRLEKGGPLYYFVINLDGKTEYTEYNLSTGVRTHYFRHNQEAMAQVNLQVGHKDVLPLNCTPRGFRAPVVFKHPEKSVLVRYAERLLTLSDARDKKGLMSPLGIMGAESSLMLFYYSGLYKKPKSFKRFVELVGPVVKRMAPKSVETIARRLPKDAQLVWNDILTAVRYKYYPAVQRYADWVNYGLGRVNPKGELKPDWESVHAGVVGFVQSKYFKDKEFKDFFRRETKGNINRIGVNQIFGLSNGLRRRQRRFVLSLPTDRNTLVQVERLKEIGEKVYQMVENLRTPRLVAGLRDYSPFVGQWVNLKRTQEFKNKQRMTWVAQQLSPYLRQMEGEHLKKFLSNFVDEDKEAILQLRNGVAPTPRLPASSGSNRP